MKAAALSRPINAPSSALLKFLRAQQDGRPFFTSNRCTQSPVQHGAPGLPLQMVRGASRRRMATCASITSPMESSLFSLETLWAKRNAVHAPDGDFFTWTAKLPKQSSRTLRTSSTSLDWDDAHAWGKWWKLAKKKQKAPLQPDDLPPLSGFLDDNASLGRPIRPTDGLRLRCTEFNEDGNITMVNSEFKKSELIAKYGLLPRDLRKIDSSLLPNILIRPSAILINLLHLRVLIKHNRVLVFDAYGSTDSYTQSLFMYDLEGKLRAPETRTPGSSTVGGALPYEFRALEAVLISVTSGLEGEFEGVREPVVRVLRELEEDIDRDKLRHLLIYSKKLSSFEQKARLVRDAIDDLLEADDDLADMYLSEKASGKERTEDDHAEVEMLLENYYKVCDEIVQVSSNLVSNIRNTEEVVKAILDANRNSLMLLELKFSIYTLATGGATFLAALYGMNLKNFIEDSDLGFWGVSVVSTVIGLVVLRLGFKKLHSVQRVSMWGTKGGGRAWSRNGDRGLDQVAGVARRERLRGVREGQTVAHGQDVAEASASALCKAKGPPQKSHQGKWSQ